MDHMSHFDGEHYAMVRAGITNSATKNPPVVIAYCSWDKRRIAQAAGRRAVRKYGKALERLA